MKYFQWWNVSDLLMERTVQVWKKAEVGKESTVTEEDIAAIAHVFENCSIRSQV